MHAPDYIKRLERAENRRARARGFARFRADAEKSRALSASSGGCVSLSFELVSRARVHK